MRYAAVLAMAVGLSLVGLAAAQSGILSFAPRVDIPVAGSPWAVVTGDFNGDGKDDLATANNDTDDVSVLLGKGDGSFTTVGPFGADLGPAAIQTADMDDMTGEHIADLIVANDVAGTVSVLLGIGGDNFQPVRNFAVGLSPECAGGECQRSCTTSGDCPTGASCATDGKCHQPCNVAADCTCSAAASCTSAASPDGVAIGRFNADGHLDIATANSFDDDGTVSILLGNGDGTFQPAHTFAVVGAPFGIAAGRIDADRNDDLVVSASDTGEVVILHGNGDGTFQTDDIDDRYALVAGEVGPTPGGLVLQDLDGDGDADIAVVDSDFSDAVWVLLGNGDGTFARPPAFYLVGVFPEAVAVGDFNGDRIPDLVTADSFGTDELANSVSVLVGIGDGTFAPAQSFEVHESPFGVTVGDFNGDRVDDIVTANADFIPPDVPDVSLLVNQFRPCAGDCDGNFKVGINELITGVNIALGQGPTSVTSCSPLDINHNNMVEIDELVTAVNNALSGCPA